MCIGRGYGRDRQRLRRAGQPKNVPAGRADQFLVASVRPAELESRQSSRRDYAGRQAGGLLTGNGGSQMANRGDRYAPLGAEAWLAVLVNYRVPARHDELRTAGLSLHTGGQ